jgi:hypothetical protein
VTAKCRSSRSKSGRPRQLFGGGLFLEQVEVPVSGLIGDRSVSQGCPDIRIKLISVWVCFPGGGGGSQVAFEVE